MDAPKVVFGLHRAARVVLDPRDWMGTAVRPPASVTPPGGSPVTPVVRVNGRVTVTAAPAAPGWPFAGPVEWVTQTTPAGLVAFFGRVRSPDGGPLRRLPLGGVTCDLTVTADGYRPAVLAGVPVPVEVNPPPAPTVRTVFLYPLGPLPDATAGPTVLTGRLTNPDGSGLAKVRVSRDRPSVPVAETDENGDWVLEHHPPPGPTVDLTFTFPDGTSQAATLAVVANRTNRFPRTTVSGRVQRADGRPVAGATITVVPFPGRSVSRADGSFVFALVLDRRAAGAEAADVTATAPDGTTGRTSRDVKFGQDNPLGPVVV